MASKKNENDIFTLIDEKLEIPTYEIQSLKTSIDIKLESMQRQINTIKSDSITNFSEKLMYMSLGGAIGTVAVNFFWIIITIASKH